MDGIWDPALTEGVSVVFAAPPIGIDRSSSWYSAYRRHGIVNLLIARFMGLALEGFEARLAPTQPELFQSEAGERRRHRLEMPPPGAPLDGVVMLLSQRALQVWGERARSEWVRSLDLTFIEHAHSGVNEQLGIYDHAPGPFVTLIARHGTGTFRFMKITEEMNAVCPHLIGLDLCRLMALERGRSEFGYVRETGVFPSMEWRYDADSDDTQALVKSLESYGKVVRLSDVATIWRGTHPFGPQESSLCDFLASIRPDGDSVLLLNEDTVRMSGSISRRERILEDGDICLGQQMLPGHMLRCGLYKSDGRRLSVSPWITVVRLNADIPLAARHTLTKFLNSYTAYKLARAKGVVMATDRPNWRVLDRRRLADLPVPLEI